MADPLRQDLAKLEALAGSDKSRWPSINSSLDDLLASLYKTKQALQHPTDSATRTRHCHSISQSVDNSKKAIEERQKEIYNSISRLGKALDKKFTNPLPTYENPPFTSNESVAALESVLIKHFLRTGQFGTASVFLGETGTLANPELAQALRTLQDILTDIKSFKLDSAIEWTDKHSASLQARNCHLEFNLHKLQYLRILAASQPDNMVQTVDYLQRLFPKHIRLQHVSEICRLTTALAFMPLERLKASPYANVLDETLHQKVLDEFVREYCASCGLSRLLPLRVVTDVGAGGAMIRIEKGKKLMREKKGDWSQTDELPIEIPLNSDQRFHSIFACPVSKEQATKDNYPMMLPCGHVLAKESLSHMVKSGNRLKCPYCPEVTTLNQCIKVVF